MRTPTRTHQADKHGQLTLSPHLTNVKQYLTSTRESVLELTRQGKYQAQIARQLGISPSAVSQHIRKLAEHGYIDKPIKQPTTRGGYAHPLDVRWRSLKWNLAKPVELKHDEQRFLSGVLLSTWRVKEATITTNYGKKRYSLEITCGLTEGDSVDEVTRRHDEKCLAVFRWVAEHFPELKQATNEYAYTVNRVGEVNVKPLKPYAEEYIGRHGRLRTEAYKIDDSLKNGGELQLLLQGIATKTDIAMLAGRFDALDSKLDTIGNVLGRIAGILEKIAGISGKEGGEGSIPIKPIEYEGGDYL